MSAQDRIYRAEVPMPTAAMRTNQLTFTWLGINYSHEMPIARQSTLTASAMMFASNYDDIFQLRAAVSLEPRLYYNLRRRGEKGRNTWFNSADYFSFTGGYTFAPIYIESGYIGYSYFTVYPAWGIRRAWGHFLFDVNTGPVWWFYSSGEYDSRWNIQITLGYIF